MILTLTGTHSTGKSTLLEALKQEYPLFYFNDSSTRDVTNPSERRLDEISDRVQGRIFHAICEKEHELNKIKQTQHIFMDRSFIDFTAYTLVFQEQGLLSEDFTYKIVTECENRLNSNMYSKIFYLPIEFELVDDGIRSVDKNLQVKVDQTIQELLRNVPNVIKLTGDVQTRILQIRANLY